MNKVQISQTAYRQLAAICSLLIVFAALYLYFLNVSVVHVVMRKEAAHEQSQLRAEISMLESDYIAAQHEIARRIATLENGQSDIKKTFISRAGTDTLVRAN